MIRPYTIKFPLSIHPTAEGGQIAEAAQKVNVNINVLMKQVEAALFLQNTAKFCNTAQQMGRQTVASLGIWIT